MKIFEWIKMDIISCWNSVFQKWPEDKNERRRIKAFILGAGSGGHCARKIETEEKEGGKEVDGTTKDEGES